MEAKHKHCKFVTRAEARWVKNGVSWSISAGVCVPHAEPPLRGKPSYSGSSAGQNVRWVDTCLLQFAPWVAHGVCRQCVNVCVNYFESSIRLSINPVLENMINSEWQIWLNLLVKSWWSVTLCNVNGLSEQKIFSRHNCRWFSSKPKRWSWPQNLKNRVQLPLYQFSISLFCSEGAGGIFVTYTSETQQLPASHSVRPREKGPLVLYKETSAADGKIHLRLLRCDVL